MPQERVFLLFHFCPLPPSLHLFSYNTPISFRIRLLTPLVLILLFPILPLFFFFPNHGRQRRRRCGGAAAAAAAGDGEGGQDPHHHPFLPARFVFGCCFFFFAFQRLLRSLLLHQILRVLHASHRRESAKVIFCSFRFIMAMVGGKGVIFFCACGGSGKLRCRPLLLLRRNRLIRVLRVGMRSLLAIGR